MVFQYIYILKYIKRYSLCFILDWKFQMDQCIIHCTDDTSALRALKDWDSWKTLLESAKVRKHAPILQIASSLKDGDSLPMIKYHRNCRSIFKMKREIQALQRDEDNLPQCSSAKLTRSARSTFDDAVSPRRECDKLQTVCIFCKKTKYLRGSHTREKLRLCKELRADEKLKISSKERGDERMMAITVDDMIAKEAMYHNSCYKEYVKVLYTNKSDDTEIDNQQLGDGYVQCVMNKLDDLLEQPNITEYTELTELAVQSLKELGETDIVKFAFAKKNLKRKILSSRAEFRFIEVNRKLYVYPVSLTMEDIITRFIKLQIDYNQFKEMYKEEKTISICAQNIRNEITNIENKMLWPPQPKDLSNDAFQIPAMLNLFLNKVFTGRLQDSTSSRVNRIKLSMAQDLVYNVNRGLVKTPKSILLPYLVKSLTNCTELINVINLYENGVSYSILQELETEQAYLRIEHLHQDMIALPKDCKEETLTIVVADNIDYLEETLSGKFFFLFFFFVFFVVFWQIICHKLF